jgi:hypothetical protein
MLEPSRKFQDEGLNVELRRIYGLLSKLIRRVVSAPNKPSNPETGTVYCYGGSREMWDGSSWTPF